MLTYRPGNSIAHNLDPRTKLFLQACFALPVIYAAPPTLALITIGVLAMLSLSRLSLFRTIYTYRYVGLLLLLAPVLEGLTLNPPWISLTPMLPPALASYRVALLILISAIYIHTTSPQDSRAAVQQLIPGKPGQFLGAGVMIIFHVFPQLLSSIKQRRQAMETRLSDTRPLHRQIELLTTNVLTLLFHQSDQYSTALRTRCFAWNPTLPHLEFNRIDATAMIIGVLIVILTLILPPIT